MNGPILSSKNNYSALSKAEEIVNGDRQSVYGHPYDDFGRVAIMTKPILESEIDPRLKHALYMIQVKIARLLETPGHVDSIVDVHGYMNTYEMVLERMEKELEKRKD
jgi:hypothetical protein